MSSSLLMIVLVAVLYAAGVYLLLDRSLTRILLGILVLGNATNLLVLSAGGPFGAAPLVGTAPEGSMSDALVQALVLTAIVITLGVAAFFLSLIHRAWTLEREDDLMVDSADRSVRARLVRGEQLAVDVLDTTGCEDVSDTDGDRRDATPAGAGAPGGGDA